jgi:hypothetical protein
MSTTRNLLSSFNEKNNKNPMNNSKAKMRYSFPKSERFKYNSGKNSSMEFLYNIPDNKETRGTSLGYGKKLNFTKVEDYKTAPYTDIRNNFDKKLAYTPSYSFGVSRKYFNKVVRKFIYITYN